MVDEIKGKKIGGVKATEVHGAEASSEVDKTEKVSNVSQVSEVKGAAGVDKASGVGGVGGNRRATRIMSAAEREQLLALVDDEAKKMFSGTQMSPERLQTVRQAVKIAIDSGIIVQEDLDKGPVKN